MWEENITMDLKVRASGCSGRIHPDRDTKERRNFASTGILRTAYTSEELIPSQKRS
jgi:hypothetical protein